MRRSLRYCLLWVLATSLSSVSLAAAQSPAPDSVRVARLAALGRLWGAVKYFHPAFLSREVNWDSALVAAVPRVSAARSTEEYVAAISTMLEVLGDPVTRVVTPHPARDSLPAAAGVATASVTTRWEADSILVVSIPSFDEWNTVAQQLQAVAPAVSSAGKVVFDLRGPASELGFASYTFEQSGMNRLLPPQPIAAPGERFRMYSGFPPQGSGSDLYWAGTYDVPGVVIRPTPGSAGRRVAFVIHAASDVPHVAWAMQRAGLGAIVLDGAGDALAAGATRSPIALGEGRYAEVRLGEVIGGTGGGLSADTVILGDTTGAAALRATLESVRRPARAVAPPTSALPFVRAPENAYPDMRYPSLPYRLLAVYRWWNAINYFYPYKHLMGEEWNAVLARSIPRFEAARDSTEYALAVAEMVTHIHDSHGFVRDSALQAYFGRAQVGVLVQYIEGQPVVVRVADDTATVASGIAVGDVIVRVDEEDAGVRRDRLATYLAHSTPQALNTAVATRLLNGPEGSVARLVVRRARNALHELAVPRRPAARALDTYSPRSGPILRMLPGNVGYADLARLTQAMVDSMFEVFRDAKAIVFDDRGYPLGTVWSIAPRLTDRDSVIAARFQRPLVMSPDSDEWATDAGVQRIPPTTKERYHGRTVLLIDERTISHAEHTGLFFEAANRTTFIGSPTMGANGDVTSVVLPGGLTAFFTGLDVRHADGRQLQRVGLVPDIVVRPTIAGIRAGRDEVLERALRFLGTRR